jgi:membrane protein implicated in regulation of membrane protease activity
VEPWLVWVVVAGVLAVAEVLTLALVAGLVAPAALLAAAVAALGGDLAWQLAVFAVGSGASLAVARPIARRHLTGPPAYRGGVAALTGAPAVVLERVDATSGVVKIGGETWSARAFDETQVMEPGETVHVYEITGATALVHP